MLMKKPISISRAVMLLILASAVIRGVLASILELGNDEVYYWTYALFPDWSHFDHPPMVGWMIQFFTLDLRFDSEFFIRLPAVLLGAVNTFLVYMIGKSLKDDLTGWYAALLYTTSVYCFVIAGIFILPDTPQLFYWLLALYFLLEAFNPERAFTYRKFELVMAGLAIGLALLSKYTSAFLWLGAGLYILFFERRWFRTRHLYIAMLVSVLILLPVMIWNIRYDFISFTYHGGRVGFFGQGVNLTSFARELTGQIFYNNPVNVILIFTALVAYLRGRDFMPVHSARLIALIALPLILLFLFVSLFRDTLPHWTGPAYVTLLLLAAAYLRERTKRFFPPVVMLALLLLLIIATAGAGQVNKGWFFTDATEDPATLGKHDVSLDLYGWKQIGEAFSDIYSEDRKEGRMTGDAPVFAYRWFPAANIDYYVAGPAGTYVLAIGDIDRIHKYAWINQERGGFRYGMDGYYITTSRDYADPLTTVGGYFEKIVPADTVALARGGKVAGYAFIYRLYDLRKIPDDPLE